MPSQVLSFTWFFTQISNKFRQYWRAAWNQSAGRMRPAGRGLDSTELDPLLLLILGPNDIFADLIVPFLVFQNDGCNYEVRWGFISYRIGRESRISRLWAKKRGKQRIRLLRVYIGFVAWDAHCTGDNPGRVRAHQILVWGSWDLLEILLYHIMYRNMRW